MNTPFFLTAKTKSSLLSKYISYYYFDTEFGEGKTNKIVYYPNTFHALTIYKNSLLEFKGNHSIVKNTKEFDYTHYYGGLKIRTYSYTNGISI